MQPNEKKIWFPAKKYGWGWGVPTCWQGWVVVIGYAVLVNAGIIFLPKYPALFFVNISVLSTILIAICYSKGEKPRWRWGKD